MGFAAASLANKVGVRSLPSTVVTRTVPSSVWNGNEKCIAQIVGHQSFSRASYSLLGSVALFSTAKASSSPDIEQTSIQPYAEERASVFVNEKQTELSPWHPDSPFNVQRTGKKQTRFRQHVNPLARKFQIPTELPPEWPRNVFTDPALPLFLDIGCGKGGFLIDLASHRRSSESAKKHGQTIERMNYLGLEIRPGVAQYAQDRLDKWNLSGTVAFLGCNANVDLERLLTKYTDAGGRLCTVSVQFPDPHFKNHQAKRRVVTPALIQTLARFLGEGDEIFIQSDVKPVLDDMRKRIREHSVYFEDAIQSTGDYMEKNPLVVPTERETSVLKQDLPVYRTLFRRTDAEVEAGEDVTGHK